MLCDFDCANIKKFNDMQQNNSINFDCHRFVKNIIFAKLILKTKK